MRRSLSVRITTIVFVVLMSVPAFAAPRRDDSPIGGIERAITRIIKQIVLDLTDFAGAPK
jgi:hypothetical protein